MIRIVHVGIDFALMKYANIKKGEKMNTRKEVFYGMIWGIAVEELFGLLVVSGAWSMESPNDDGDIEITFS